VVFQNSDDLNGQEEQASLRASVIASASIFLLHLLGTALIAPENASQGILDAPLFLFDR
jgi:hypothetical protein